MAQEKNFENKVKDFLKAEGCWFIKYWSGSSGNGKKFTKDGIPDLLVCCNGYFLGIELKAPNGKPSELQLKTLEKITMANGLAFILYPKNFADFKAVIHAIKEGVKPEDLIEEFEFLSDWWYLRRKMYES